MGIVKLSEKGGLLDDGWLKWECPDSPDGYCQYDDEKDPALDQCLYCGDPYERK